jgi:hypothetical protein
MGSLEPVGDDPLAFEYDAYAAVMVLGDPDASDREEALQPVGDVGGVWDIAAEADGRVFWPELTAALMAGLRACVKDAGRLGRVLAFSSKARPGVAHVLLLELPSRSGMLEEIFELIFGSGGSSTLQKQFVEAAISVVDRVSSPDLGKRAVFESLACAAGQAMGTFNTTLDCATARAVLEQIRQGIPQEDDIPMG